MHDTRLPLLNARATPATRRVVAHGCLAVALGLLWVGACVPQAGPKGVRQDADEPLSGQEQALAEPSTPVITLAATGVKDGLYLVEAHVRNVAGLRGYQVSLAVTGGEGGNLALERIRVDTKRADYVFAGLRAVNADDVGRGRLAGALFAGTVDVAGPGYLGTFAYRATPEASGTFRVSLRTGRHSSLYNAASEGMGFEAGPGAEVFIGAPDVE